MTSPDHDIDLPDPPRTGTLRASLEIPLPEGVSGLEVAFDLLDWLRAHMGATVTRADVVQGDDATFEVVVRAPHRTFDESFVDARDSAGG